MSNKTDDRLDEMRRRIGELEANAQAAVATVVLDAAHDRDREAACVVVGHRLSVKQCGSTAHGLVHHADRSVLVAPGR